jgi:uncharacterized membrane protein
MRIELIHPLLVHFPLALLTIGVCLRALAFFYQRHFLFMSWIILGIGVCFAWMAILAGEFAADIVGKNLCEDKILDLHSTLAYTAAFLFTSGLLLDWAKAIWARGVIHKYLTIICFLLFLGAASILVYVGYLGATMVYEQGAAVQKCCKAVYYDQLAEHQGSRYKRVAPKILRIQKPCQH